MFKWLEPLFIAQVLVCAFFAACFIQSGFDKIFDWKGNLDWIQGHFAKTPFAKFVPLLLFKITVIEVGAGLVCAVGVVGMFIEGWEKIAGLGIGLACLALLMLFTGQRFAKDYVGAHVLATYFGVAILGLYLHSI
ncbi:MAG: DoxX family protein [Armatimonadetes bacterium]|nr:DoxX family protein [Armatimonadota bacterium]